MNEYHMDEVTYNVIKHLSIISLGAELTCLKQIVYFAEDKALVATDGYLLRIEKCYMVGEENNLYFDPHAFKKTWRSLAGNRNGFMYDCLIDKKERLEFPNYKHAIPDIKYEHRDLPVAHPFMFLNALFLKKFIDSFYLGKKEDLKLVFNKTNLGASMGFENAVKVYRQYPTGTWRFVGIIMPLRHWDKGETYYDNSYINEFKNQRKGN